MNELQKRLELDVVAVLRQIGWESSWGRAVEHLVKPPYNYSYETAKSGLCDYAVELIRARNLGRS